MITITTEKFPNTTYVYLPDCDELKKMVEPFITVTERGMTFVDQPKYNDFLKAVFKYDKETLIKQTEYFDAQVPLTDLMVTQEVKTLKVCDLVSDDDDHTPPLKRTRFSDANPKKLEVTFEDVDEQMVRCCFQFNRQIIDIIRSINGREYLHSKRSWFIPKNKVPELLAELHKLNEN